MNYEVIGLVQNHIMFSPKYEREMKIYPASWVVAMANFYPDQGKLSFEIRWFGQPMRHFIT